MNVPNTIDVTAYTRVASAYPSATLRSQGVEHAAASSAKQRGLGAEVEGVNDTSDSKKAPTTARVDYNLSVAQARELKPVNVYPKNATAIDTFLNIKHYSGGEHIVNTYA